MRFINLLVLAELQIATAVKFNSYDNGYYLPTTGLASTTQFYAGPEFADGTSCGARALPNGHPTSGKQGGGPGYLYAAINQLGFGANPHDRAGGPGGACGLCFKLTPESDDGTLLSSNALTFKIIDECPWTPSLGQTANCNQCATTSKNSFGKTYHFDIAIDAMSTNQYNHFFKGVTYGSDWKTVHFEHASCSEESNPQPELYDWGCSSAAGDCQNNLSNGATVCSG